MSRELRQALEQVARRFRLVRLWTGLAICWLVWALLGWGVSVAQTRTTALSVPGSPLLVVLAAAAAVSAMATAVWAFRSARDRRWVARRIETKHPELGTGLLSAIEEDEAARGRPGFLQSAVIREALDHHRTHDWTATVPVAALRGAELAHIAALALLIVASAALVAQARPRPGGRTPTPSSFSAYGLRVDPGHADVEKGTALLVVARFGGAVPADASLVIDGGSSSSSRMSMTRSLEDPTFAGRLPSVDRDLTYRVEFAGRRSESYKVRVFEYPELRRADAKLTFPSYTSLAPKTVEDVRHVTAVEGTELTLLCRLNKDVMAARLIDEQGQTVLLKPDEGSAEHLYQAKLTLTDPRRYRVQLIDNQGRRNKLPAELAVNVTKNRPATVKMTRPAHDVRVSPVEELALMADLGDDFGVVRHGLSYSLGGAEPREIVLKSPEGSPRKLKAEHLLDFESLKAAPDQLVTYFVWAEDIDPDGKPRRSSGDMFFAEVRHFEEIFRQGEQPPSGSEQDAQSQDGGNAQASEKLAELQKQVINGTWTLVRRETGTRPSPKLADDSQALQESQHSALDQAATLGERLRDAASKANLERATRAMKDAESHLGNAAKENSPKPLASALAAEQAAYQALLKLRAREFEVIRNNSRQRQGQAGRSAGGPSQQQLQQLELSADENRYEEQRTARARQEASSKREQEQRETRQVLNRLKELAQRQADLNDRLKELQSALEAAKTPKAREELERQLKRLRDQEQQVLRDTDELRERMENEENRERMAEARQGVEESREHVRQASEALDQGKLSQAVTEGTRAGRQLNDLRDDLRKGAANRFSEEMTEMRDQARRLDEDQAKLTKELDAWDQRPARSLRDPKERDSAKDSLEQQKARLGQLVDRMRQTVHDAEDTEPLLAKNLFDTVRKTNEKAIPDALEEAEQLVDAGIAPEASKSSRRAGEGLKELRENVERAAESVLGDETAGLRRAEAELDELSNQVQREIARATGHNLPKDDRDASRAGRSDQQQPRRQSSASENNGQGRDAAAGERNAEAARDSGDLQANRSARPRPRAGQPAEARQPRGQPGRRDPADRQEAERRGEAERSESQEPAQDEARADQPGQNGDRDPEKGQRGRGGRRQRQDRDPQKGQGGGGEPREGEEPSPEGQGEPQAGGQPGGDGAREGRPRPAGGAERPEGRQAGAPSGGGNRQSDVDRMMEGITGGPGGPITGEGFRQWSDRMREVEELLEDPDLRAEAARIRDRARGAREEFKRHSKEPRWEDLKRLVADPLRELRDRVAEEVRRRESPDSLVPIDRDPVPPQFAEGVRRYYERLGSGQ